MTGIGRDDSGANGNLQVVTPGERLSLTRDLGDRTHARPLPWSGVWRLQLFIPTDCERFGFHEPLPAVDFRITAASGSGSHVMFGQLPWHIASESPWAVLTAARIERWPP